ncbi:MAG TPA: UDP-N-acetylmuramate dehydrogenase [Jatrophihabitans sp.]
MHTFADLTTLRVGGPIAEFVEARTTEELLDTIRAADAVGRDALVIGDGSNLLVGDGGFAGLVVRVATQHIAGGSDDAIWFDAGFDWDSAVQHTLDNGYSGLEALSGIPGRVGGAPVQNVGAYGALTSDVLAHVTVYDRESGEVENWSKEQCDFGRHRTSIFKHSRRWVILSVGFVLSRNLLRPVRYQALADQLGVVLGDLAPATEIREAVLALRRRRGMVLDSDDHDTWSVGSFFLNPVVTCVPDTAKDGPSWPDESGIKLSAAWLIEHAGFPKGYGNDKVTLSAKHTLAITNRGHATTEDVLALAGEIRTGVQEHFGITLEPECHLINCSL